MRPTLIVEVLPLAQLLVEQLDVVRDPVSVQQLVELLVVHAVRSLSRSGGPSVVGCKRDECPSPPDASETPTEILIRCRSE